MQDNAEPSGKAQGPASPPSISTYVRVCQQIAEIASVSSPILGSKKIVPMRHAINIGKGLTILVALALMFYYKNTHHFAGWLYVALHGSYSILWVSKDYIFPDPRWGDLQTAGGFVSILLVLAGYWMSPYFLNAYHNSPSNELMLIAALMYIVGVSLMFGSDCQKFYQLRYARGLIRDGFFTYTRNPNYLGEMMLYSAFAILSGHWMPWAYLLTIWVVMFFPNMLRKDASLARYKEWSIYSKRSGLLIPNFMAMYRDCTKQEKDST